MDMDGWMDESINRSLFAAFCHVFLKTRVGQLCAINHQ